MMRPYRTTSESSVFFVIGKYEYTYTPYSIYYNKDLKFGQCTATEEKADKEHFKKQCILKKKLETNYHTSNCLFVLILYEKNCTKYKTGLQIKIKITMDSNRIFLVKILSDWNQDILQKRGNPQQFQVEDPVLRLNNYIPFFSSSFLVLHTEELFPYLQYYNDNIIPLKYFFSIFHNYSACQITHLVYMQYIALLSVNVYYISSQDDVTSYN